jgi:hypothetical protein
VDKTRFDNLTKSAANQTDRRRLVTGLGGLALASVGVLGLTRSASAQVEAEAGRRRCIERCVDHAPKSKRARDRCRRRCENR